MTRKHAHYYRSVEHLKEIDIYRFLDLFGVTDQALGHAIKKLVVPGMRGGGKTSRKDIEEAIDTLQRKLEMMDEDGKKEPFSFFEAIKSTPDEFQIKPEIEWIYWNGGYCPVNHNQHVVIQKRDGNQEDGQAEDFYWQHFGREFDIIKYAVIKDENETKDSPYVLEWIDWNGGDNPLSKEVLVEVQFRNGLKWEIAPSINHRWYHNDSEYDIIKYAVVK